MKLYSTNNTSLRVDFPDAVFNSLPQDNGLYMPVQIKPLDAKFLDKIDQYSLPEIAFEIAKNLLQDAMPENELRRIVNEAFNFPVPLIQLDKNTFALELFHGPSLAFKDFGARFMSRIMGYFLKKDEQMLDILVATSGDTGGAVAAGFYMVPNTRVTILYPKGKVSDIQKMQLTTNGENIHAVEVEGTFDDCQALVKLAFLDQGLKQRFRFTSANSINIARLIPQTFYYFNAYAQLKAKGMTNLVFSVPSGNFGNVAAGLLAFKMGLPVTQFLAATNINDTVPSFLKTGIYTPKPSVQTYSNAMDVGNPSNWVRIMDLFKEDPDQLKVILKGYSFSDEQTLDAINRIFETYNYVTCPHTAIGWLAANQWRDENQLSNAAMIFLSTAHPCKFPDVIPAQVKKVMVSPEQVIKLKASENKFDSISSDFSEFKNYLLEKYSS
ncbi:MAG: threonine synthase [Flavobacterium sp.]|nr:threonine synthase [Pedobacter sp.]